MNSAKIILKKNEDRRLLKGHFWVFSNEINSVKGEPENGDVVEVYTYSGISLGYGFYNRNSLIRVRLLLPCFDGNFKEYCSLMIKRALKLRQTIYPLRNSYRLIFSESDFMPGLIVDRYNDTYVLQVYCYGMERNISSVINSLESLGAENIFSINDIYFRKMEGLNEENHLYKGQRTNELIDDGFVKYRISFSDSLQKTGFYFDQADNREYIHALVKGKTVLDGFCNSGGFGLHSLKSGADSVTFVDSSGPVIESLKENLILNDLHDSFEVEKSDMFEFLQKCISLGRKFDVIMLDPPSFAKNKKSIKTALKGYEKLALMALRCLNEGGFFVYSSCSHHIKAEDFINASVSASVKVRRRLQLIKFAGASSDHPILPAMPETEYLKFSVFSVE